MKDPMYHIRGKIIAALSGNITLHSASVPVTNKVRTNQNTPYIWVYSLSTNAVDDNTSKFCTDVITRIECVTRFDGDIGGDLDSNKLASDCLNLLISKPISGFDLSSQNFNVYTSSLESLNYIQEDADDHTYYRAIIELSNRVEQTT
jgi:hypothetical protein|tara:strand:+ start:243 stop:683 length:441 start_codon:yes stop_codon:yes gene_type:complete